MSFFLPSRSFSPRPRLSGQGFVGQLQEFVGVSFQGFEREGAEGVADPAQQGVKVLDLLGLRLAHELPGQRPGLTLPEEVDDEEQAHAEDRARR